jgi:hypothetical protein
MPTPAPAPVLEPCVAALPVAPPVVETLATTGTDGTFLAIGLTVAVVLVAVGVISVMKGRSRRGILAALVLPVLLLGGLALSSPQSAYATTGAPTVTTPAVISSTSGIVDPEYYQTNAAIFDNPEGCGVLSYQWQLNSYGAVIWDNYGPATASPESEEIADCFGGYDNVRLLTTLTNSSGSVTDSSNVNAMCS